jgi:phospholipase C
VKRLTALFGTVALLLLGIATPAAAAPAVPVKTTTPIEHLVVLMQSGHSFDNYFGTFPGADGVPADVCQRLDTRSAKTDHCVKPFHLGKDTPPEDFPRGLNVMARQYNGGKMDGFVAAYRRLGLAGTSSMGYYDDGDLPYTWNVARQYVLFDRFFASGPGTASQSYLDWFYSVPGTKDRARAGTRPPSIFDRLGAKGVTAKFYVEGLIPAGKGPAKSATPAGLARKVPLLATAPGSRQAGTVVDLSEYYSDLQHGTLPAVSYIVSSNSSENPPSRPEVGQVFLQRLTSQLVKSRYWSSSAFLWTYDSSGGWYDHVPPPLVGDQQLGFRVPALLMSPFAKKGVVDHTQLDYTGILKFIEDNWSLAPLTTRDASSPGLKSAFDFAGPGRAAALVPADNQAPPALVLSADASRRAAAVIYVFYGGAALLVLGFLLAPRGIRLVRARGRVAR